MMTIHIRNMVCNRCIRVVSDELAALGHDVRSISLGEAVLSEEPGDEGMTRLRSMLLENGFELIEDARLQTIERIKRAVLQFAREDAAGRPRGWRVSDALAAEIGRDYSGLSALFSSVEGVTIEQFLILQRIEYAKELLKYGELTLSEIADRLGYSSVQHLSSQFKKVTGLTPSRFRSMASEARIPLDRVGRRSRPGG